MASKFFTYTLLAFFALQVALSATPPPESDSSPSPSPQLPAGSPLLSAASPSPHMDLSPSPTDSPMVSPPAPPPSDLLGPGASPTPAHSPEKSGVPAPAPVEPSDINHTGNVEASGDQSKGSSGMSGGKKAGIAIGVILGAGVVVVGGLLYKKRQQNIRRSQYGYAARGELL
ncbi:classical arabinogalactan protein 10 [Manihot esculenta]|uniref:Uncharacterized protein n=1 Tax=Manihot esculenta TaxID=3983 RepID=A0A2C9VYX7_MANES|nr:classical arabinogalactan protein 10 [Manihot esculenta]OAY51628.1 hypothetical protein MANES_04G021600v8 [Manihot esculenta]